MIRARIEGKRWMVDVTPGCLFIRGQQSFRDVSWEIPGDAMISELDSLINMLSMVRASLVAAGG